MDHRDWVRTNLTALTKVGESSAFEKDTKH